MTGVEHVNLSVRYVPAIGLRLREVEREVILPPDHQQPRLLVIWGKYDLSFDLSEPQTYRRDVPNAQVHVLDAGHFALDTAADEIAALVRGFVASSPGTSSLTIVKPSSPDGK